MSPEEQRIAIAEAHGWKSILQTTGYLNDAKFPDTIPDYLNDLNAMHEAEKMLYSGDGRFDRWCEYWEALETLTQCRTFDKDINSDCLSMLHATAAQRAKAFLKTIGKWKDQ